MHGVSPQEFEEGLRRRNAIGEEIIIDRIPAGSAHVGVGWGNPWKNSLGLFRPLCSEVKLVHCG